MSTPDMPPTAPPILQLLARIPLLGRIVREVAYGEPENKWYALVAFATLWILAILVWGVWALLGVFTLATAAIAWVVLMRVLQ